MSGCTFPVCIFLMNPIYPTEYPDYLELDTHMHIVLSVFSIVNGILLVCTNNHLFNAILLKFCQNISLFELTEERSVLIKNTVINRLGSQ